ncbi:MAG: hypothetical protein KF894_23695 [Labilithrix sp.]|nr:hypothetical protein [Labilithrix sp.]
MGDVSVIDDDRPGHSAPVEHTVLRASVLLSAALGVVVLASSGCRTGVSLGGFDPPNEELPPPFEADAGEPDANAFAPLCKATECPAPYDTCSDDAFRCETNFDIDNTSCGACGVTCPSGEQVKQVFGGEWFCQSARCELSCDPESHRGDCNGDAADGCEADLRCDPNNCGACGVKCPAGVQCVKGNCGCPAGLAVCGDGCFAECAHLPTDDANCGTCGNQCPFPEFPPTTPDHTYYGCGSGSCDELKCENGFKDCNGDVDSDGCEVDVYFDPMNCGGCGKKCADGQFCEFGTCKCGPQETNCPFPSGAPFCVKLDTDPANCGVCSHWCPQPMDGSGKAVCRNGKCEVACNPGYADCDGDVANGCETFIAADPRNCGACGAACDLALGQPCVNGACLLRPCEPGEAR